MNRSMGKMGVPDRGRRNLGGGRMSFAGFGDTSLRVGIVVVVCDLFRSASVSEI